MKKEQIDILKEAFEEWLQIHDLDYDYWIHTGDEWRARGEQVLQKAEVVLAFENQLVDILNYTGPWDIEEELQDLAGGFGYSLRWGTTGTLGSTLCQSLRRSHPIPHLTPNSCGIRAGRRRDSGYSHEAARAAKSAGLMGCR